MNAIQPNTGNTNFYQLSDSDAVKGIGLSKDGNFLLIRQKVGGFFGTKKNLEMSINVSEMDDTRKNELKNKIAKEINKRVFKTSKKKLGNIENKINAMVQKEQEKVQKEQEKEILSMFANPNDAKQPALKKAEQPILTKAEADKEADFLVDAVLNGREDFVNQFLKEFKIHSNSSQKLNEFEINFLARCLDKLEIAREKLKFGEDPEAKAKIDLIEKTEKEMIESIPSKDIFRISSQMPNELISPLSIRERLGIKFKNE
jgi:hypothetical protein